MFAINICGVINQIQSGYIIPIPCANSGSKLWANLCNRWTRLHSHSVKTGMTPSRSSLRHIAMHLEMSRSWRGCIIWLVYLCLPLPITSHCGDSPHQTTVLLTRWLLSSLSSCLVRHSDSDDHLPGLLIFSLPVSLRSALPFSTTLALGNRFWLFSHTSWLYSSSDSLTVIQSDSCLVRHSDSLRSASLFFTTLALGNRFWLFSHSSWQTYRTRQYPRLVI